MAMFATAAIGATGLGCLAGGWVEQNAHMRWRWIQWIHVMYGSVLLHSARARPDLKAAALSD